MNCKGLASIPINILGRRLIKQTCKYYLQVISVSCIVRRDVKILYHRINVIKPNPSDPTYNPIFANRIDNDFKQRD